MSRNIKYFTIFLLIIPITTGLSTAQQEPNNLIIIEALPKATKGFPVVMKVTIKGPQTTPFLSIFYDDLPVTVYLISQSDGKEYVIQSHRRREAVGGYPGGGLMDLTDKIDPPFKVPEKQKYTMMFDLWSVSPGLTTETFLSDVPPGKYNVFMEFNFSSRYSPRYTPDNIDISQDYLSNMIAVQKPVKSNTIELELIEPTEQEKKFIQKIRENRMVGSKAGVNWTQIFLRRIVISDVEMLTLTQISKEQISFHQLLSKVDITEEQSRSRSIKDVNNASLPKFFEPEQKLLLVELKGNKAEDRELLFQEFPQLRGMTERYGYVTDSLLKFRPTTQRTRLPDVPKERELKIDQKSNGN